VLKRFVIVGGGTAGWIAATFLAKWCEQLPGAQVTLIESSEIGIIGTGEGATLQLRRFCEFAGISDSDLLREADATFKLGIRFRNWRTCDHEYLNPFSNVLTPTFFDRFGSRVDLLSMHRLASGKQNATQVNVQCHLIRLGKSPWLIDPDSDALRNIETVPQILTNEPRSGGWGYSFHFDGHKIGGMLRRRLVGKVQVLDGIVAEGMLANGDLEAVRLRDGRVVSGDFFLDCSGFHRLLIGKMYESRWVSWSRHLVNNSAMPFQIEHRNDAPLQSCTGACALTAGWMWEIPTRDKLRCGYVFNDGCITPDQAMREVEAHVGSSIEPLRHIHFDTGRFEQHWIRNCVAIGLASNFAEPLEATSIHSTITQAHLLVLNLQPGRPESWEHVSKAYNKAINDVLDNIRDYLAMHYLSDRTDSEYWQMLRSRHFVPDSLKEKLDVWQHRFPCDLDFSGPHDLIAFALPSHMFVLDGLGLLPPRLADRQLLEKHKALLASLDINQSDCARQISAAALDHREIINLTTGLT
jgi:flavin-dependent dehydrogenase